jgi:hypothetical protein
MPLRILSYVCGGAVEILVRAWSQVRGRDVRVEGEGIEKLEVFMGDYRGRDHVELVGRPRGKLAHYTCRLGGDVQGVGEREVAQNSYYG